VIRPGTQAPLRTQIRTQRGEPATAGTAARPRLAVRATGVRKRFGSGDGAVQALDGVDLEVPAGGVYGLLGPNGAGKTTLVRILATLLLPDAGEVQVAGVNVLTQPKLARTRVGLCGQSAAVDELLTGRQNLEMVGRLYHLPADVARARAEELLDQFALADAAGRIAKTYSGGMRRRLDLAASLVVRPPVIFLDEPTTGLDPVSRLALWDVLTELVDGGVTLLLTTQYLEEADRLASRLAVIDRGRLVAEGTPTELKARVGGQRVEVVLGPRSDLVVAERILAGVGAAAGTGVDVDAGQRRLAVPAPDGSHTLIEVARRLDEAGVVMDDVALRAPSLDEVFLALTGHRAGSTGEPVQRPAQEREGSAR